MKVFITGASGSIGREVAREFEGCGWTVTRFSRMADSVHEPMASLQEQLFDRAPEFLIHLAWSTFPATSEMRPASEWLSDLPILVNICQTIARQPVETRSHLVFLSSGSIYGENFGFPFMEESQPAPKGWYARGKVAAECLIKDFCKAHGVPATIIRASSVYGFTQSNNRMQGIIPKTIESAIAGMPCMIWGDGTARKDFLHVHDLIAFLRAVIALRLTGIFNACTGETASINEILDLVEGILGCELSRIHKVGACWDVQNTLLSNNKMIKLTGWSPTVLLLNGISELITRSEVDLEVRPLRV
jgi:UDP-glucose 4-epimerase